MFRIGLKRYENSNINTFTSDIGIKEAVNFSVSMEEKSFQ